MKQTLAHCVQYSLQNFLYDNATFMAERLYAQEKSDLAKYLLASCYYRAGKFYKVYDLLKGSTFERNRYLLAMSAFRMEKYRDAEIALVGDCFTGNEVLENIPNGAAGLFLFGQICRKQDQNERATLCFQKCLAINPFLWTAYESLCEIGGDVEAEEIFGVDAPDVQNTLDFDMVDGDQIMENAVKLTRDQVKKQTIPPIHIQEAKVEPKAPRLVKTRSCVAQQSTTPAIAMRLFKQSPSHSLSDGIPSVDDTPGNFYLSTVNFQSSPFRSRFNKSGYDSDGYTPTQVVPQKIKGKRKRPHQSEYSAPRFNISKAGQNLFDDGEGLITPQIEKKGSIMNNTTAASTTASHQISPYPGEYFRTRDVGLNNISSPLPTSVPSSLKLNFQSDSIPNTPVSPEMDEVRVPFNQNENSPLKAMQDLSMDTVEEENNHSNEKQQQQQEEVEDDEGEQDQEKESIDESVYDEENQMIIGATDVLSLLRVIGKAYFLMCKFDSQEAVDEFQRLPKRQFDTGYILCKVGKCFFEIVQYHKAKKMFEIVRQIEPYRTEDMEIYSTILWQLNETVQLSYLAKQLVELDRHSPSTWCAVGNCFSLQKDHESALSFFKRAIQVNPNLAYPYTLCGHEQVASDNWDKALAFYRNAIRIDARHYNAWYGLGMIYFRQEKYSIAEYHFNKALEINSKNSVLYCYLGMVLRASKRYEEAEIMLSHAIKIDPTNALARYKKAVVLINLGKLQPALTELLSLQESSPKEAPTCFLLGKVYKRMGQLEKALYYFTLAMDFDTKSSWTRSIKQAISKLGIPDAEGGDVEAADKETEELEDFK